MNQTEKEKHHKTAYPKAQFLTKLYNQFINLFWTGISFLPVLLFWIKNGTDSALYIFLITSFIITAIPEKLLKKLQVTQNQKVYERLRVKTIRKFVQDGDWSKNTKGSNKSGKIKNRTDPYSYMKTIAMYERYHWCCFLFFLQTTVYGSSSESWVWLASMSVANILYNVCPILLQQYNKLRMQNVISRMKQTGG